MPSSSPVPTPVPTMGLDVVGEVWKSGSSMLTDVIDLVASQPLLIILLVALPLVGLGIGLFKRLVR